jgi:2-oxoglutarate/2-oxoacid ferredoxin oxidoreductase subunit alpha
VPVASRNIFPSNIHGLPTWYEVRVSEAGHIGRRGGADMMVAMNPQTWEMDIAEIDAGGYLFYDSTRPMPAGKFRGDVTTIGLPLTAICNARYKDPRQRQLFKNIIYLGALSELLGIEVEVVEKLIGEQFKGKDKLIPPNLEALALGREHARNEIGAINLRVKRADAVGNRIFLEGNNAAGLGAVYGGATVAAWYPITPSTSLAEAFGRHCAKFRVDPATGKHRYAIVQAEDEIAAIGMVIGATWNGARAFTATAGPGISLMQEFIGLAYFAEIPHPAGGHSLRRLRLARRHQACAAFARRPARVLRVRRIGVRPRRPAADAGLRHARPRHRHERMAVRTARLGPDAALRPRQGAERG